MIVAFAQAAKASPLAFEPVVPLDRHHALKFFAVDKQMLGSTNFALSFHGGKRLGLGLGLGLDVFGHCCVEFSMLLG